MEKSIKFAQKLCDTIMRKYDAEDLPPKGFFHYHQGVFLSGMYNTYKICKDERYFDYIKNWVDSIVYEDGSINTFREEMLDDIQPGILLIHLYERTKEEKYKKALQTLMDVLEKWPQNSDGGRWHKLFYKDQMWLDGIYMAAPLEAQYSKLVKNSKFVQRAIDQALLMWEKMGNRTTGLLYHAWDYSHEAQWADKCTGLSGEVWGRALGWYVVSVLDILENIPKDYPNRKKLEEIEKTVLEAIIKYQDKESGMWYQVVDKGDCENNWTESSCSSLFVYSLAKAVRMNILDKECMKAAIKGFEGIINKSVTICDDELLLGDVCIGTNVCNYQDYIERPVSVNDLHGSGAFLLMCAELGRAGI